MIIDLNVLKSFKSPKTSKDHQKISTKKEDIVQLKWKPWKPRYNMRKFLWLSRGASFRKLQIFLELGENPETALRWMPHHPRLVPTDIHTQKSVQAVEFG